MKKSWAWVYTFNASAWEAEGGVRVHVYSLVYITQTPKKQNPKPKTTKRNNNKSLKRTKNRTVLIKKQKPIQRER